VLKIPPGAPGVKNTPYFYLLEIFFSYRKIFVQKVQNLVLKYPSGGFRCKIEIVSTDNVLCRKFAAVCPQIANVFLTHDAADRATDTRGIGVVSGAPLNSVV